MRAIDGKSPASTEIFPVLQVDGAELAEEGSLRAAVEAAVALVGARG